jgi:hypothetical protein
VFGCGVLRNIKECGVVLRNIQESNYILTKRNEKLKDPIVLGYNFIFVS